MEMMEATTRIELVYTVLQFYLIDPGQYRSVPFRPILLTFSRSDDELSAV
jgi:hypothetical protein